MSYSYNIILLDIKRKEIKNFVPNEDVFVVVIIKI